MEKKMTAVEELLTNKDLEALIAVGVVKVNVLGVDMAYEGAERCVSCHQTSTHSDNSDHPAT